MGEVILLSILVVVMCVLVGLVCFAVCDVCNRTFYSTYTIHANDKGFQYPSYKLSKMWHFQLRRDAKGMIKCFNGDFWIKMVDESLEFQNVNIYHNGFNTKNVDIIRIFLLAATFNKMVSENYFISMLVNDDPEKIEAITQDNISALCKLQLLDIKHEHSRRIESMELLYWCQLREFIRELRENSSREFFENFVSEVSPIFESFGMARILGEK